MRLDKDRVVYLKDSVSGGKITITQPAQVGQPGQYGPGLFIVHEAQDGKRLEVFIASSLKRMRIWSGIEEAQAEDQGEIVDRLSALIDGVKPPSYSQEEMQSLILNNVAKIIPRL